MADRPRASPGLYEWTPTPDSESAFSTGIEDLDKLLGGGYPRAGLSLLDVDAFVTTADLDALLFPTVLNFLYQSRGTIAILPARDAPHAFRDRLLVHTTRRRFDARVRIVDYVGQDEEAPYVVSLRAHRTPAGRTRSMERMASAERAARGSRSRQFLELNAFEVGEIVAGPEAASRMFLHGVKRAQGVGNLVLGLVRPGLATAPALRSLASAEIAVRRDAAGLELRGVRPSFGRQRVVVDATSARVTLRPRP